MNNPNLTDLTLALEVLTEKLDRIERTLENLRQQVENAKTVHYHYYQSPTTYPMPLPWCNGDGTGNPPMGSIGVRGVTYWGGAAPGAMPGAAICGKKPEF